MTGGNLAVLIAAGIAAIGSFITLGINIKNNDRKLCLEEKKKIYIRVVNVIYRITRDMSLYCNEDYIKELNEIVVEFCIFGNKKSVNLFYEFVFELVEKNQKLKTQEEKIYEKYAIVNANESGEKYISDENKETYEAECCNMCVENQMDRKRILDYQDAIIKEIRKELKIDSGIKKRKFKKRKK